MSHHRIRLFIDRVRALPAPLRLTVGMLFLLGGALWFLPILGLWMILPGLLILSADFKWAKRSYVYLVSVLRRWQNRRRPELKRPSD